MRHKSSDYLTLRQILKRYGWGPDRMWVDILLGEYDCLVPDPLYNGQRLPAYLRSRVKEVERTPAFRTAAFKTAA